MEHLTQATFLPEKKKIVLIDVDNTIFDTHRRIYDMFHEQNPTLFLGKYEEITASQYSVAYPQFKAEFHRIFTDPVITSTIAPIKGALKAILEIAALHEIFFCSCISRSSMTNYEDKRLLLKKYFGEKFRDKLIGTEDKTLIQGDYLIDDSIDIDTRGIITPSWEHIIFERPFHNRYPEHKRKITWNNWKEILPELL